MQRLGGVHVDVDPDQIEELARAERPTRAVLHALVEILGRDPCLVEDADAVVEQRDQDAVDHETWGVVAADRRLADALGEGVGGLEDVVRCQLGADDLHERHQRSGVEEVHPDDPFRPCGRRGDLRHRERRGVGGEDRIRADDAVELGEELSLHLQVLEGRFDDQATAGEVGQVGREPEARHRRVPLGLLDPPLLDCAGQEVADPAGRLLAELRADLAPDDLDAALEAHLRDPCAHRAEPDDADPGDLTWHGRRSYFAAPSTSARATSNCSSLSRMCEWRQMLCGKTPTASTGGASCRSETTASGRISNRQAHRSRDGSCSGSATTSTTPKIACHTAA